MDGRGACLVVALRDAGALLVTDDAHWLHPAALVEAARAGAPSAPDATTAAATEPTTAPATTAAPTTSTLPADEQCTDDIMANPRWVCLTAARLDSGALVLEYDADFAGDTPNVDGGFHLHLYPSDGTVDAATMGVQFEPASGRGIWLVEDRSSAIVLPLDEKPVSDVFTQPLQPKVCARIASATHELVPDEQGGFATGNCVPIEGI